MKDTSLGNAICHIQHINGCGRRHNNEPLGLIEVNNLSGRPDPEREVNGHEVLASVSAWLSQIYLRPKHDWGDVLGRLRDILQEISQASAVRNDAAAQDILQSMTVAQNMEDVDGLIDALGLRVAEIIAERTGNPLRPMQAPRRLQARLLTQRQPMAGDAAHERPSRIFLRL